MSPSVLDAISALIKTDPTVSPKDRPAIIMAVKNHGQTSTPTEAKPEQVISRAETGTLLDRGTRAVDLLADAGLLRRVKLPGRKRACGFLLSEVQALIMASVQQKGSAQ